MQLIFLIIKFICYSILIAISWSNIYDESNFDINQNLIYENSQFRKRASSHKNDKNSIHEDLLDYS